MLEIFTLVRRNYNSKSAEIFLRRVITLQHWVSQLLPSCMEVSIWLFSIYPYRRPYQLIVNSLRDLCIDTVVDRFIFTNNQIYALHLFYLHMPTVAMGPPKTGISFNKVLHQWQSFSKRGLLDWQEQLLESKLRPCASLPKTANGRTFTKVENLTCEVYSEEQHCRNKTPDAGLNKSSRPVLSNSATRSNLNASYFLTVKDNMMLTPIFGMLSSRAIQNIPNMLGYLQWLKS